jgi:hypothetical protein
MSEYRPRDGAGRNHKLMKKVTRRVHLSGFPSFVGLVSPVQENIFLSIIVGSAQENIFATDQSESVPVPLATTGRGSPPPLRCV